MGVGEPSGRVGSFEAGKDADVVVLDGPPLSVKTWMPRGVRERGAGLHEVRARTLQRRPFDWRPVHDESHRDTLQAYFGSRLIRVREMVLR